MSKPMSCQSSANVATWHHYCKTSHFLQSLCADINRPVIIWICLDALCVCECMIHIVQCPDTVDVLSKCLCIAFALPLHSYIFSSSFHAHIHSYIHTYIFCRQVVQTSLFTSNVFYDLLGGRSPEEKYNLSSMFWVYPLVPHNMDVLKSLYWKMSGDILWICPNISHFFHSEIPLGELFNLRLSPNSQSRKHISVTYL